MPLLSLEGRQDKVCACACACAHVGVTFFALISVFPSSLRVLDVDFSLASEARSADHATGRGASLDLMLSAE